MVFAKSACQPTGSINKYCIKSEEETAVSRGLLRKQEPCSFHTPHSALLPMTPAPQTSPTCDTRDFTNGSAEFSRTSRPAVITHSFTHTCTHFNDNQYLLFFFLFIAGPVVLIICWVSSWMTCVFSLGTTQERTSEANEIKWFLPFYRADMLLKYEYFRCYLHLHVSVFTSTLMQHLRINW